MRACICVHENNEFSSRWPSRRHRATNKWMWKRKPIVFVTIRCIRANWEFYGHKQRDQIFPFMSTFTPFATAQHTDSFTLSGCESGVIHGNIYIYMHGNVVADIMALAAGSSLSLSYAYCTTALTVTEPCIHCSMVVVVDFAFSFLNSNRDCDSLSSVAQWKRNKAWSQFKCIWSK